MPELPSPVVEHEFLSLLPRVRAVRRVLKGKASTTAVRRAELPVVKERLALKTVRVAITR